MISHSHSTGLTQNVNYNKNNNLNPKHLSRNGNPRSPTPTTQACAVCKYQRRKCTPDCILAPYFPHDRQRQFLNAHKLFGVSNITKIIQNLEPFEKDEAMRSIIYQSDVRACDPVGGCYRIIHELQMQIEYHKADLELVMQQLAMVRSQANQRHQQQQQQHPMSTFMNVGIDDMFDGDDLSLYNSGGAVQFHYSDQPQMETTSSTQPQMQESSLNPWCFQNSTEAVTSSLSLHGNEEFESSKSLMEVPSDHRNDQFRFDMEEIPQKSDEAI